MRYNLSYYETTLERIKKYGIEQNKDIERGVKWDGVKNYDDVLIDHLLKNLSDPTFVNIRYEMRDKLIYYPVNVLNYKN